MQRHLEAVAGRPPAAWPRTGCRADFGSRQKAATSETPGPSTARGTRSIPGDPPSRHGRDPCDSGPVPDRVAVAGVPERAWLSDPLNLGSVSLILILKNERKFCSTQIGGITLSDRRHFAGAKRQADAACVSRPQKKISRYMPQEFTLHPLLEMHRPHWRYSL